MRTSHGQHHILLPSLSRRFDHGISNGGGSEKSIAILDAKESLISLEKLEPAVAANVRSTSRVKAVCKTCRIIKQGQAGDEDLSDV